ncbi:hypothetical protein FNJ84_06135 [Paracoccus sp. M683]|uniref:hypothetical protein n=1 Tax=Paracoccus sp. M683 TaxID=2594268 RepID=UPI00117F3562|nr:hypothetical protein [Paracoccus sp. M683]TRW98354.1 hypothetical protein FNJ84_06135 [Paracoccus sp. M683]
MADRRLDTHLESEGAEFLVCGLLMIEGIPSYKAYTNTAGYDILASHPTRGRVARIQVKSRWASNHGFGFPLKNADSDFVVFVALNRGTRNKSQSSDARKGVPEFYVFPTPIVLAARREDDWKKVQMRRIERLASYRDNWKLVADFLDADESPN